MVTWSGRYQGFFALEDTQCIFQRVQHTGTSQKMALVFNSICTLYWELGQGYYASWVCLSFYMIIAKDRGITQWSSSLSWAVWQQHSFTPPLLYRPLKQTNQFTKHKKQAGITVRRWHEECHCLHCCINTQCDWYLILSPTACNLCWCFNINAGTDILSQKNEEGSTSFSLYSQLTGGRKKCACPHVKFYLSHHPSIITPQNFHFWVCLFFFPFINLVLWPGGSDDGCSG